MFKPYSATLVEPWSKFPRPFTTLTSAMDRSSEERRAEILLKKAKLEDLRLLREARREGAENRTVTMPGGDVCGSPTAIKGAPADVLQTRQPTPS